MNSEYKIYKDINCYAVACNGKVLARRRTEQECKDLLCKWQREIKNTDIPETELLENDIKELRNEIRHLREKLRRAELSNQFLAEELGRCWEEIYGKTPEN